MDLTEQDLARAEARMEERRAAGYATSARLDRQRRRVIVALSTGVELAFPPELAPGLKDASDDDLAAIEISPSGLGLIWPKLDADLYVPALLQGIFGPQLSYPGGIGARVMGASGGRARSAAKAAAARSNGLKGGRPRKQA